jgi:predicted nucleotidyltransferase/DNA-binding XRE family transcriptional regulator
MNAGQLIAETRARAGLTQAALARSASTSQAAIARYESGVVSPSMVTLERVLRAAGATLHLSSEPAPRADLSSTQAQALRLHRKEVLAKLRAVGASNVRVFGSVARGLDVRPDSDIDLLVDFDTSTAGLLPILRVGEQLTSLLGYKVDVAPADVLRDDVARSAFEEAVPL